MMNRFSRSRVVLLAAAVALPLCLGGCGLVGGGKPKKKESQPFGASGIPPQLRARGSGGPAGGAPVVMEPGSDAAAAAAMQLTPEEDIIFTDPDRPDSSLPELADLLSMNKTRGPWEESASIARKRSTREGKPLLIWFTDSARSPMCKAISQELFSTGDFNQWADEKLVRLRVDTNVRSNKRLQDQNLSLDEEGTMEIDMRNYVKRLKKQYKVLGHPTIVMLSPTSGEVLGRWTGYKRGQSDYYWGLFKHAEVASSVTYEKYLKHLESKGYRQWEDRTGRKVLAKLTGYSKGTLTLIEPDGTRCKTNERKLSKSDRAWIDEQKRLRGID